ncbi:Tn3 family transposase (plasmid) [Rhizobium anhuiense bv. trifolii]|nr:Tn3 family transposase [Rhizobium anhuiense]UTS88969.1 Tn3 family transposase [Rhizobium anhuiense bv. trifolii]
MRDRSFESHAFRASGLKLVVSAIVHWSMVYLDRAVTQLKRAGREIPDTLLKHISPLSWHINFTGTHTWDAEHQMQKGFRSLRLHLGHGGSHKFSLRSPLAYEFAIILFRPQTGTADRVHRRHQRVQSYCCPRDRRSRQPVHVFDLSPLRLPLRVRKTYCDVVRRGCRRNWSDDNHLALGGGRERRFG